MREQHFLEMVKTTKVMSFNAAEILKLTKTPPVILWQTTKKKDKTNIIVNF